MSQPENAVLAERIESLTERVERIEGCIEKISRFVDECTGGRKALLLVLKIAGSLVAMAGAAWAIVNAKIGG